MSQRIVLQSMLVTGVIVLLAVFNFSGCFNHAPASDLPTTKMQIGQKQFELEIANTQDARMTGLMRRDSMPGDHGMSFVFSTVPEWTFDRSEARCRLRMC